MAEPDFLIGITIDENDRDISWMDADEKLQAKEGDIIPYGVGLVRVTEDGKFEPDWSTFTWSCWADSGLEGTYPNAERIPNPYLSDIAKEQIKEFAS